MRLRRCGGRCLKEMRDYLRGAVGLAGFLGLAGWFTLMSFDLARAAGRFFGCCLALTAPFFLRGGL